MRMRAGTGRGARATGQSPSDAVPAGDPRRRWAAWFLAVYGAIVVAVLVLPIGYSRIVGVIHQWIGDALGVTSFGAGWVEFAANVVIFAPLGFLLTLLFRHPWHGTAVAVALSVAAELGQFVIPARQPSLRDLLANALGAALGALLAVIIVRRRERRARVPAEVD
ncbi:VanZ family protein [Microbacterium sp.]|uniref:VanZ family protein n=1 Tax=Microbacterium sp. TaxID=51671 RepID=UPI0028B1A225|nr:VanZ family protein [Microbacterium sp.]